MIEKEKNYQKYLPAIVRFSADSRHLNIIIIQPDKFMESGGVSMLSNLKTGDISANKMAMDLLREIPERAGLTEIDIYGDSFLYSSLPISRKIPKERISISNDGRDVFYKLISVKD